MELSLAPDHAEARAGARCGLHRGAQALRSGAVQCFYPGRGDRAGRPAEGRVQSRHRLRRERRRSAGEACRRRHDLVHRLDARRRAHLGARGAGPPEGVPQGGYYVRPTVFGKVSNSMTIAQEEIFGPVLAIIPYGDEDEAVRIANDTVYGLAGAVWSKDEARAQRVARRMRAGQIDINGGAFNMNAPFGGFKQSGHGREAGVYGLEEFLEYKSLQLKG